MTRPPFNPEWRRACLEALVIVALGIVIGLSLHWRPVVAAFGGEDTAAAMPVAGGIPWPVPVGLEEVRSLLERGALAIDARSPEAWQDGHLPGALSFPLAEVEERLTGLRAGVSPQTTLVVYCSGYGCPDSFDLGVRLKQEGFEDVRVFEGGFPQWQDAGLPVEGRP